MLTPAQVEAYARDGFVIVEDVFSPDEIGVLRAVVDKAAGEAVRASLGKLVELQKTPDRTEPVVRRLRNPAGIHQTFADAIRHEKVLDIVRKLIGPDLRVLKGKVNMKPARVGEAVEFHQDWAFYPHTNDDILTASIFLDDITEENGPIQVLPGSHTGPILDHHEDGVFVGVIDPAVIRKHEKRLVPMTGRAGAMSFHHVRIIHGSPPNRSDRDRRMLVFPIVAADAWPLAGFQQPIELIFGETISGSTSITPRMADIPVRIPYPTAKGSLFDMQGSAKSKYF